jgi:hypothetical protein
MGTQRAGTGVRRASGGPDRYGTAAALLAALLCILLAPAAARAFGPKDGLYYVGSPRNSNLLVQTLSSGLVVVTRTNFSRRGDRYDVTFYAGALSGDRFTSANGYGHAGAPPQLEIDFSARTFTLTFPGAPPTTEPLASAGCPAPTSDGPYDGPYFGDGGLVLVQSVPCGGLNYVIVHQVFGLTDTLQGSIYYTWTGLSGPVFTALRLLRASPTAAVTIDFQRRTLTRTPSGGSPVSFPIFPAAR